MLVAGKYNTYEVIQESANDDGTQRWFKLRCVDLFGVDDLGDQIMCSSLGQELWIANYHFRHMPVLAV